MLVAATVTATESSTFGGVGFGANRTALNSQAKIRPATMARAMAKTVLALTAARRALRERVRVTKGVAPGGVEDRWTSSARHSILPGRHFFSRAPLLPDGCS